MAIAALVIGIVSILISFIPFCGSIAIVPALVGIVLSIIALIKNKQNTKTMSITGIVLSSLALIIIFVWIFIAGIGVSLFGLINDTVINKMEYDYSFDDVDEYELNEDIEWGNKIITFSEVNISEIKNTSQNRKYNSSIRNAYRNKKYYEVTVNFKVQNVGKEDIIFNPYSIKLLEGNNGIYTANVFSDNTSVFSKIKPGETVEETVSFKVLDSYSKYTILYEDYSFQDSKFKVIID